MLTEQDIERIASAIGAARVEHPSAEQIRQVVGEELDSRRTIDIETHRAHHDFIRQMIESRRIRAERWEQVRRHVLGWAVVGLILWTVYRLGEGVIQWIRRMVQ